MIERFVRGLAIGSLVGAIFAGWVITRRRHGPEALAEPTATPLTEPTATSVIDRPGWW